MDNKNQKYDQKQIEIFTSPVSVPATQDPNAETYIQQSERNGKFIDLPVSIKMRFSSPETSQKIQVIGQKYQFELLRLANITRLIREYYFGEVDFNNFPVEIEKRMSVSLLTAQEITRYIKSEIIDWDPWAEYLAKLPKLPIREIAQKYPKITNMEITKGYIELKNSDDLENPTIKNWIKDYISHLGYDHHSQMQRADYLFHSENGRDLDSQDREKLGIILKSFDENILLPVDEENGEIVFDGMISESQPKADRPMSAASKFAVNTRVLRPQPVPQTTNNFIKPYAPISQLQRPTLPQPLPSRFQPTSSQSSPLHASGQVHEEEIRPNHAPIRTGPTQNFVIPNPVSQPQPIRDTPANFASQVGREEINKYFSAPESSKIPEIKIHSITEYNEPRIAPQQTRPQQNVQRPIQISPQPSPYKEERDARPKHRMIEPFFSKPRPEPKLDGNIVDLSEQ